MQTTECLKVEVHLLAIQRVGVNAHDLTVAIVMTVMLVANPVEKLALCFVDGGV